tara:strand:- start:2424 stop:2678 length:255 start_codon:yes stop_codon:yes gene_type:complete
MAINDYLDSEILDISMNNAYRLLTNKATFDQLFPSDNDEDGFWMPYRNFKNPSEEEIDDVIDYFCELEEYEKCAELVKIKEKKK